jgi:hypothetical protein
MPVVIANVARQSIAPIGLRPQWIVTATKERLAIVC